MNGWLLGAIIAAVVIVVVIKRLKGEPLNARDLLITPVVLTGIGVASLVKAEGLTGTDLAWVIPGALLGCGLGAVRGATVHLSEKAGALWQRYTGRTFLVLVGSLVITGGFGLLATHAGVSEDARPMQLNIGVSFLGEALVIGARGLMSGVPFAPERPRR
ncbi:DUF1453 family protein [Streptomyces hiroshimensis]|uniref:DUF1453 domain-containing protein n=1 Tax=Streptomyces hiroshimensis TaxID=66424 RepID=A0ABQ2YZU4_9ACTN|nr:DUF1453 family protein [Streptomyces hiroshimensis]GGX97422.1 hypothetical protein GCM10010324_49470 [Streptomyces hiroshimensis]